MLFRLGNQYDGVGRDTLFASGKSQLLGRGGLDGDVVRIYLHYLGQALLHYRDMGIQLGAFGTDGYIGVPQFVALLAEEGKGLAEQYLTVYIFVFVGRVGKVEPDVAQVGCSQQCVAQGMDQNVGIRVP